MVFQTRLIRISCFVIGLILLAAFSVMSADGVGRAVRSYLEVRARESSLSLREPAVAHRAAVRWLREADLPRAAVIVRFLPSADELRRKAYELLEELVDAGYLPAGRTLFFHLYRQNPEKARALLKRLCSCDRSGAYGFCFLLRHPLKADFSHVKGFSSPQALLTLGEAFEVGYWPRSFEKARRFFLAAYQAGLDEGATALARLYEKEASRHSFVCTLPESRTYDEFLKLKHRKRAFYAEEAVKWYEATTRTYDKAYRIVRLKAFIKEAELSSKEKLFFASRGVTLAWRDLVPPGERKTGVQVGRVSLTQKALECLKSSACSRDEAIRLLRRACMSGERTAEVVLADFIPQPAFRFSVYRYHAERGSAAAFRRLVEWLVEKGRFREAEAWLAFGRKKGIDEGVVSLLQAHLWLAQGKKERAFGLLKSLSERGNCSALLVLLKLNPQEALSSGGLKLCSVPPQAVGEAYYRLGDFPNALKYFLKAVKERGDASLYKKIGLIYMSLGDEARSRFWLLKAFESGAELGKRETVLLAEDLAERGVRNGTVYLALAEKYKGIRALCCAFMAAKEREPDSLFLLLRLIRNIKDERLFTALKGFFKKGYCRCLPK